MLFSLLLGFKARVQGSGFRFRVQRSGFGVQGSAFSILALRASGSRATRVCPGLLCVIVESS